MVCHPDEVSEALANINNLDHQNVRPIKRGVRERQYRHRVFLGPRSLPAAPACVRLGYRAESVGFLQNHCLGVQRGVWLIISVRKMFAGFIFVVVLVVVCVSEFIRSLFHFQGREIRYFG